MRIAQLAPLTESVPPKSYGGTELVVNLLTEGLVAAGHEVTLFASGDSETSAELVSITPKALRLDESIPVRRWPAYALRQLLEFQKRQHEFDIVHNHMGYEAFATLKRCLIPNVTTNHNPIKDYCAPLYLEYADLPFVSISHAYKQLNYPEQLNYVATIYNGIDVEPHIHWMPGEDGNGGETRADAEAGAANKPQKPTSLLFLGRVCHDKGTATAIEIAQKLGMPLKIAGKVDAADRQYYEQLVKPHLNSQNIEYVGEVNFKEKLKLYNESVAVVYPIAFDEPFGLVVAEALASGVPIMAFERGSMAELITDGETGILGKNADDLIKRFAEVEHISANKCRESAKSRFSKERMVSEYIKLFESLC
jgi:glycosyltransferase involved in cell wall biosynthesis